MCAQEAVRGCGYRQVGGMYMVGTGLKKDCDRLPVLLPEVCPCCGAGVKQARGWTWVDPAKLLGGDHSLPVKRVRAGGKKLTGMKLLCPEDQCPVCRPTILGARCGLVWVGKTHYTPESFVREARDLGVSKRIAQIPKDLVLGETWVLVAHPVVGLDIPLEWNKDRPKPRPGIFYAFQPTAIEKIVTESQAEDQKAMDKLGKRGITPVVVPDDDPDHR